MKRIIIKIAALVTLFTMLFSLSSCKKIKSLLSPQTSHECSYVGVVTSYPRLNQDGKCVFTCECGKSYEEILSWKQNEVYGMTRGNDQVRYIVDNYWKASFSSAEEMFNYDLSNEYLECATSADYSIYVNIYTGVVYYRENTTGRMVVSNPYNFAGMEKNIAVPFASQLAITYSTSTDVSNTMYSSEWSAQRNQIETEITDNGIRVSYTFGVDATRTLIPICIEAHEFENDILRPIMDAFYNKMVENLGEAYALDFFGGYRKIVSGWGNNKRIEESDELYYNEEAVYSNRYFHEDAFRLFWKDLADVVIPFYESKNGKGTPQVKEIENLALEIQILYGAYYPFHPDYFKEPSDKVPEKVVNEDMMMYVIQKPNYDHIADKALTIFKYCPEYNFEKMLEDEKMCGYEHPYSPLVHVFKIDVEYVFNNDGSFSVNPMMDSLVYNDVYVTIDAIKLMYDFGNGYITSGEHIFLSPDSEG